MYRYVLLRNMSVYYVGSRSMDRFFKSLHTPLEPPVKCAVIVKVHGYREEWAERVITALSALAAPASWLPYKQFTCLIDWHKMDAGLRLNSVSSPDAISIIMQTWSIHLMILFITNGFSYLQVASLSGGITKSDWPLIIIDSPGCSLGTLSEGPVHCCMTLLCLWCI